MSRPVSRRTEQITVRVREFISSFFDDYNWFDGLTGISASKWRDLGRGKTKAVSAAMLEALCVVWPEFAYWFVTGNKDCARGQTTPREYFQWEDDKPNVFFPAGIEVRRAANGVLESSLITRLDRSSPEHELQTIATDLWATGLVSYEDAQELGNEFWKTYVQPLKPGKTRIMAPREIKEWLNKHHIRESL